MKVSKKKKEKKEILEEKMLSVIVQTNSSLTAPLCERCVLKRCHEGMVLPDWSKKGDVVLFFIFDFILHHVPVSHSSLHMILNVILSFIC